MEQTEKSWQETSGSNGIAMETDSPELTVTSVTDESFQNIREGRSDQSFQDIQTGRSLSPNTVQQLQLIEQHVRNGKASIVQDKNGRPTIQYERKSKVFRDASKANLITECVTDNDGKKKMEYFLEHIKFLKTHAPPSGVVFDKTQVHTNSGKYREGYEFQKTRMVLGSGTMAGDIVVIEDKKTRMKTAQKTIMISDFRKEEIRAWVDLAKTGFAPALYLVQLEGNKVVLDMEILSEAKTLRTVIDKYLWRINASCLDKPFSLYVLDVLLGAIRAIHATGWTHGDLHAGNVLIQKQSASKLRVRIVDFGMAQSFDGPQGLPFKQFRKDIRQVVRIFSALYCGQEFDDDMDLQRNWQTKINEVTWLALEDKEKLFCLIGDAMNIAHPTDVPEFHRNVQDKLGSALPDEQSHEDMNRRVVAIIFPEIRDVRALHDRQKEGSLPKPRPLDVADSVVPNPPHSTSVKHHDVAGSRDPAFSRKTGPIIPEEMLKQIRLSVSIKPHD